MVLYSVSLSWEHSVIRIVGVFASIMAALVWLATTATLFGLWAQHGFIRYEPYFGDVVYISHVGAHHKAVFITGTVLTGTFFVLTLLFTKFYFDMETRRRFKRSVSFMSIICGLIAAICLLLLAIFDLMKYKKIHNICTGLFILFILLSTIFTVIHRFSRNEFNLAVFLRLIFVLLIIPVIIIFIVLWLINHSQDARTIRTVTASLEWAIALLFVFYLILFALDLLLYK